MPNRILREGINSSPRVNSLSESAEVFYKRLLVVVDDYGRYYASPATLRGACWPAHPEKVTEDSILQSLCECIAQQLLIKYTSKGIQYLQLHDFRQQIRSKSKFPDPDINCLANDEQLHTPRASARTTNTDTDNGYELRTPNGAEQIQIPSAAETIPRQLSGPLSVSGRSTPVGHASGGEGRCSGQPGQPGGIGLESGGDPAKQGAPVVRVEGPRKTRFMEFWSRYSQLRDGASEKNARQMWLSLDCDDHVPQILDCLTSYEQSRDVVNGAIMKAENWLVAVRDSGWKARWPAAKKAHSEPDPYRRAGGDE